MNHKYMQRCLKSLTAERKTKQLWKTNIRMAEEDLPTLRRVHEPEHVRVAAESVGSRGSSAAQVAVCKTQKLGVHLPGAQDPLLVSTQRSCRTSPRDHAQGCARRSCLRPCRGRGKPTVPHQGSGSGKRAGASCGTHSRPVSEQISPGTDLGQTVLRGNAGTGGSLTEQLYSSWLKYTHTKRHTFCVDTCSLGSLVAEPKKGFRCM